MDKKIGFFRTAKAAITNFDAYKYLTFEKTSKVFKYFIIIVLSFTLLATLATLYPITKTVESSVEYLKTGFPDFKFENNTLNVVGDNAIYLLDESGYASLIIDDNITYSEDNIKTYKEKDKDKLISIILLKDSILAKTDINKDYIKYDYSTISANFNIEKFDKQDVINYFSGAKLYAVYAQVYVLVFMYLFILYFITMILDMIIVAAIAFITSWIYRIKLSYSNCIKISVYALTLPILLKIIYIYVNTFTGFFIEYFSLMYNIIAYIYVITAIIIMRNDFAKQAIGPAKEQKITDLEDEEQTLEPEEKPKTPKKENKDKKEKTSKDPSEPEAEPGKA